MFKIQTFAHGTLAAALASTLLLIVPAQAGLLGGVTGSVSGAVGANGSIGSNTGTSVGTSTSIGTSVGLGGMNVDAAATGHTDVRQEAVLTRDEDLIRHAGGIKQATSARLREQGTITRARAAKLGTGATSGAAVSSRHADLETDASGSAQASREGAAVKLDVSAQSYVNR